MLKMAMDRRILPFVLLSVFVISSSFASKQPIDLTEENWTLILENEWMVEFYAPWCPACKLLKPIWAEFATWSTDLGINVGHVDVTKSPGLSGRFMVTALPTIFHVHKGEFRQYKGARDRDSFMSFIEESKWKQVDPISSWKSPNSIQMSVVSSFFKLSQILRDIHNQLMDDFGLPHWGSYLIFAVVTILLGALLGLILVCAIDLVYPPRASVIKVDNNKDKPDKKAENNSGDELADEDIKDDLLDDGSQSEGEEKLSGSDSEKQTASGDSSSSPNVRKRKARKAD